MSEKKQNNEETEIRLEDGEPEIVTLTDENNEEHRFELIGACNDKGKQYYALIPEGSENENGEFDEYIILKQIINDDGTEDMVEIEYDAEFDRIAAKFDEAFDTEVDYDN